MRIALVRSLDGYTTVCGPDDHGADHPSPMNAAITWHLESGHIPSECLWVEVELPPIPDFPSIRAKAEAGHFPKSFMAEMDA